MCGEWGAILLIHTVCVAVISGQQNGTFHRKNLLYYLANTGIDCFHCLNGCIEYAGVADHIAVCKV